jgi:enamine deaminase RidA (YjgF/YER057c/UK114 family)
MLSTDTDTEADAEAGTDGVGGSRGSAMMDASVLHLSPEGLHRNPAYSQAIAVSGDVTTVYIGGQNAVDEDGNIVGGGDLRAQSLRAIQNVQAAVAAAGGGLEHVIKWNVLVVAGQPIQSGFEAFVEMWPAGVDPPIVTFAFVSGLAHPDFLVEIEALAIIPRG